MCLVVAVLGCSSSQACAQSVPGEDEWAQAALDDAALMAPAPLPSSATEAEVRAVDLAQLGREAARAHRALPGDVRLELRAPEGFEWFWLGTAEISSPGWRIRGAPTLCAHECTISIPPGRIRLGLRSDSSRPGLAQAFAVARPGVLRGSYVSRRAHVSRALGLMVGSGLLAVGAGLLVRHFLGNSRGLGFMLGLSIYLGGHIPGAIMLLNSRSRTRLEFTPGGVHAR